MKYYYTKDEIKLKIYWGLIFLREYRKSAIYQQRKLLLIDWIKTTPRFLIVYYIFLSYADYLIMTYKDIVAEESRSVEALLDYYDWTEPCFLHHNGVIFCYFTYMFITLAFPFYWKESGSLRFGLIPGMLIYTFFEFFRFWEIFFLDLLDLENGLNNMTAWIGYFVFYWVGIIKQWGIELEEEIDQNEELENEERLAAGKKPKRPKMPKGQSLVKWVLAMGTAGRAPETPGQTFKRFQIWSFRMYGEEFVLEYMPKYRYISWDQMLTSPAEFKRGLKFHYRRNRRRYLNIKYSLKRSWFFLRYLPLLLSELLRTRPKAVGPYSYYNFFYKKTQIPFHGKRKLYIGKFVKKSKAPFTFTIPESCYSFKSKKFSQYLFSNKLTQS